MCFSRSPCLTGLHEDESKKKKADKSKTKYECPAAELAFWGKPGLLVVDAFSGEIFLNQDDPDETMAMVKQVESAVLLFQLIASIPTARQKELIVAMGDGVVP